MCVCVHTVKTDSVVVIHGFDGVGSSLEEHVSRAQGSPAAVVVDRGSLQSSELLEQVLQKINIKLSID